MFVVREMWDLTGKEGGGRAYALRDCVVFVLHGTVVVDAGEACRYTC